MDFTSIYKCSSFFFNTINKNKTKQNNKNIQNTTNFLKDACQNKTSHELIVIENFQEKKKNENKRIFFWSPAKRDGRWRAEQSRKKKTTQDCLFRRGERQSLGF